VLAEDAIKSAIADFRRKQAVGRGEDPAAVVSKKDDTVQLTK
jgi:hypothetical protein